MVLFHSVSVHFRQGPHAEAPSPSASVCVVVGVSTPCGFCDSRRTLSPTTCALGVDTPTTTQTLSTRRRNFRVRPLPEMDGELNGITPWDVLPNKSSQVNQ